MRSILGPERVRSLPTAWTVTAPRLVALIIANGALLVLVVTLPGFVLDLLLAISLGASVGALLIAVTVPGPARLTSMPPVLVLSGLVRVLLCLSVTRLVLTSGQGGALVETLGSVAGQEDPVAGLGLLVVLAIVQLMMITAGVGRMAEVAARFALDALPGKQMGLDTAVGGGHLSPHEARREVERLEGEANFYGAMDGAGRLLRGEAMATVAIVALTAIAGGTRAVVAGADPAAAASTYAFLATGQGLVTILPAMIMATAAAITVSRSAHGLPLVEEVGRQILVGPWPLAAAAVALLGLGLLPGITKLPMLLGGIALAVAAWAMDRSEDRPAGDDARESVSNNPEAGAEITVELGMGLLGLAEGPGSLMELLPAARGRFLRELGFPLPRIVVRDSLHLAATEYLFAFRAGTLARGTVPTARLLAVAPSASALPETGQATALPDGRIGVWASSAEATDLSALGFAVMSPAEVILQHLHIEFRRQAGEVFGYELATQVLERLWADYPALRTQADAARLGVALFRRVCAHLLSAGIPLRDPLSIVEGIIETLPITDDPEGLAAAVRPRLAAVIADCLTVNGTIRAILLAPDLEDELAESAHREDGRTVAALPQGRGAAWIELLDQVASEHGWGGPVAIITRSDCVLPLQSLCRRTKAPLVAVRATELPPSATIARAVRVESTWLEP